MGERCLTECKGSGMGRGIRQTWWSKWGWCWQSRWRPHTVLPVNHFLARNKRIGWTECCACMCGAAAIREAEETNGKERGSTITHARSLALSLPLSPPPPHTHTYKAAHLFFLKICSQSDHMTNFCNLCLCLNSKSPKPSLISCSLWARHTKWL